MKTKGRKIDFVGKFIALSTANLFVIILSIFETVIDIDFFVFEGLYPIFYTSAIAT